MNNTNKKKKKHIYDPPYKSTPVLTTWIGGVTTMMRDNIEMASISENPGNVKRVQRNYLNKYVADGKKILEYMMFNGKHITLK